MPESYIQLPADGAGKRLKTWTLGAGIEHAEAVILVDPDGNLAVSPEDPKHSVLFTSELAAGASADLTASLITTAKLGKIVAVSVAGSVAAKWEIFTVDASTTLRDVFFTTAARLSDIWEPPHRDWFKMTGNGVRCFRTRVTNVDPSDAVDFYCTIYWDEE